MKQLARIGLVVLFSLSLVFSFGCSSKGSGQGEGSDGSGLSEADLNAQREGRFGSGTIPTAEGSGLFRDIPFDYDSAAITSEAWRDLEYNAEVLRDRAELKVVLEGHCDERGTADYNMALGAERAKAAREALISLGVTANRLDTISYGEEVPLDPSHNESAWAKNRRVHFSAFGESRR